MAHEFFFVGNTLQEKQLRQNLEPYILSSKDRWVKGSLYHDEIGFVYFSELGNELIKGELISFVDASVIFSLIDEIFDFRPTSPQRGITIKKEIEIFENSDNHSSLPESSPVLVQAYVLNPSKTSKVKLIEGSDWKAGFEKTPCYLDSLSEPQVTYLTKLSSSSGRDIVPINMPLYRELMKLNLIVDKGRRLALSPLGKQVCSYLNTRSTVFTKPVENAANDEALKPGEPLS